MSARADGYRPTPGDDGEPRVPDTSRSWEGRESSISQVVHEYADVCQAMMELAVERNATVSPGEYRTLNGCLDTAIAEAVTEYGRVREEAVSQQDLRHRGALAHDLRNFVQSALLSFQVLEAGKVGPSGRSAGVLGRSLVNISELADGIVAEVASPGIDTPPISRPPLGAGRVNLRPSEAARTCDEQVPSDEEGAASCAYRTRICGDGR
jgi:hypothetical protein